VKRNFNFGVGFLILTVMQKFLWFFRLLFCVILFSISAITSYAQMVYIPDTNFRTTLMALGYGSCITGDSINASCPMVANATTLDVSSYGISNLQGIQAFTSLTDLTCTFNNVTTLPSLPNTVTTLYCHSNQLTSLPVLPNSLIYLNCIGNQLPSLPVLPNTLNYLFCSDNPLSSLPVLPSSLTQLDCESCQLTSLPALPVFLDSLNCPLNQLTTLPSLPNSLSYCVCYGNQLTSLPTLPNSLTKLYCSYNQLTSLPSLPGTLSLLECGNNQLTSLPALPASLTSLDCRYNNLTSLPALPNSLTYFTCEANQLTSLPVLPNSLPALKCHYNLLTTLPALPNSLTYIQCNNNQISSLPALPNALNNLYCNNNQLTSLPALPNSLNILYCGYNQLTSLPALVNLTYIDCRNNQLTSLPVLSNSLTRLYCCFNQLTALPSLPGTLSLLDCGNNLLTSISPLSNTLVTLYCNNNQLTSLPTLPDSMYALQCYNNPNLYCLPQLNRINYLNFSGTGVSCLPNFGNVTNSIPALGSYPLCDLFNPNGCLFFWNISGRSYFDADQNCAFNSGDISQPNIRMQLYLNNNLVQETFTVAGGYYSFDTDSMTVYETRLDTTDIPFSVICPASDAYPDTISAGDSLKYNRNFVLKCEAGFDVGAWSVVGVNGFRPAGYTRVNIGAGDISNYYGVHCAAGIGGTVSVVLNGSVSYISPAPGAIAPTSVSGDTILWNIADYGTTNLSASFNIIVQTDTTAAIGSQVCFSVNVTASSAGDNNLSNQSLIHCFTVVGSFDPNEKEVSPVGGVDVGGNRWLTFTIHFQNTGTAPAEHIYIMDTLDADLDISTFQLLGYSHPTVVQIFEGGIARFSFPNINLPDSNSNEPASHGYIQYKIKLQNGLPLGTQFQNTAYIYFDFNPPVVTNTTINTLSSIPSVVLSSNSSVCSGNCTNISAAVSNGLPPFTYLWTPNIGSGAGPFLVCPTSTTTYTVVVTDAVNFTSSSTQSIIVNPLPTASITPNGPTIFCAGNSVLLTAGGANNYLWSSSSTSQSITVSSSGNYFVTVTDGNNCSASTSLSVTVYSLPTASITPNGPTTFCSGNSVMLTAGGANNYLWSNSSTSQSITVSSSGNYFVTVTDGNNCSASTSLSVTVNPLPTASITPNGPTTFCAGNSVILTAGSANNYLWSNSSTSQSISVSASGNYLVTVTDGNNCSASTSLSVTVNPLPTVSISPNGPTTFCAGNSVLLTAGGANNYLWSSSSTSQSISVSTSGNYFVTVTDGNNCSSSASLSVTVNPNPPVPNITQILDSLVSDLADGYQWYFTSVVIPGATSRSYLPIQNGNYSVVISDVNGCTASSTDYPFILTGTGSIAEKNEILIYPNPAGNQLAVSSWKLAIHRVEVCDVVGQLILIKNQETSSQQQVVIDVSKLRAGIYFLQVKTEMGIVVRKFVKQ